MGVDIKKRETVPYEIAAWVLAGVALLLILTLRLLPALFAGMLVYELIRTLTPVFRLGRLVGNRARLFAVAVLATIVVLLLALSIWRIVIFFHSGADSLPALLQKMAEIIEESREMLPPWLAGYLPGEGEDIRSSIPQWLREHAGEVKVVGKEAGRLAAHVLIGMVLGALVSLREAASPRAYSPLAQALAERCQRFGQAFRSVVFAQARIAALNTFFAWLYLGIALPLLGVHLPLTKTLVALTFVTGLLPVVGNLVSNTVVVIVSLSQSLSVAMASLLFLVVIHKLEYFLNARIVGAQISARTWELLLAMLVMEAAFGIAGLIAAPIYYAYIKAELLDQGLV